MRRNFILGIFLLVLLTCVAYFPVLNGSSGFIWDDDGHVTKNTALNDGTGLAHMWTWGPAAIFNHSVKPATQQYYPTTFTSFWLEHQAWGNNPLGYHIDNVLLQIASAVLLWIILMQLGLSPGVSYFAAALFAIHPVNVESVAWISERKNTLSLLFYLLAALFWIRWAGLDLPQKKPPLSAVPPPPHRSNGWLVWAILFFILALLAKSVTATLPATLLVLAWWKQRRITARTLAGLAPLFVVAILSALLTTTIEHTSGYIGAFGKDFDLSFPARCIIAGHAILFYLAKLLFPAHLLFFYPRWQVDPTAWSQWLYPAAVLALLAVLFALRRRIGNAPLVLALLFILALVPALGFINFYPMQFSFVADHFQYLATLIGCTIIALLLAGIARMINIRAFTITAAACLLVGIVPLTFLQTHLYKNEITLYRQTLDANPDAWIAADNLASLLAQQSDLVSRKEALDLTHSLLKRDFSNPQALRSLGNTLLDLQQYADAQNAFERALIADPKNASTELALGNALLLQKRPADAIPHYDSAAELAPSNPDYLASYATALIQADRPADAESRIQQALDLHTGDTARYQYLLGQALRHEGKIGPALAALNASIKLNPDRPEPWIETAEILAVLHKDALAIDYFESALHVRKDNILAQVELARLLLITEEPGKRDPLWAADLFRQVVEETHGSETSLKVEYAGALAAAKFYDEAGDVLQQTLSPDQQPPLADKDREAVLVQIQQYKLQKAAPIVSSGPPPIPLGYDTAAPPEDPQPQPKGLHPIYIPPP